MSLISEAWQALGEIGTSRGFRHGDIREAMLFASGVCWLLAFVLAVT